jgi:hypothetical protein
MAGVLVLTSTISVAQIPAPKPASSAPNITPPETHRTADSSNSSKQHGPPIAGIKALQKSRVETLTELVKEYELLSQAGRIDFYYVVAAQNELVDAKLDLAEKPEERMALLTEKMKLAEANLERTERRFRTSLATKSDLLWARALLLGTEIGLSQERMAAGLPAPENLAIPADGLPWRVPTEPPVQMKSPGIPELPKLPEEKLPQPPKPP